MLFYRDVGDQFLEQAVHEPFRLTRTALSELDTTETDIKLTNEVTVGSSWSPAMTQTSKTQERTLA